MSKTNWENIITGDELKKTKVTRNKTYIESRERTSAYEELVEEGWTKIQDYKDPKWIKMKKDKPQDEQFEDSIWVILFNMGFRYLNKDRHFEISYDSSNEKLMFLQQMKKLS